MKLKKGDTVKILGGNDRGKQGKIIAVHPAQNRIVVEGVNMKKKHVRARRQGQKGERIRIPLPFPVSRAALVCPACAKPTRVGMQRDGIGRMIRVCRKCKYEIHA